MAKSISKAYSKNKTDELYTPKILCLAILPYLKQKIAELRKTLNKEPVVWLPFDTQKSEFALMCKNEGIKYVCSHLWQGQDFFSYLPAEFDLILSNPPFSKKLDVFKRLNELNKPWAMVMNIMALNYQEIGNYFADHPCQLLIPDKRISFNGNQSSFNSSYVCCNFLPKDLIFVHLANNNAGKYYVKSTMYEEEERE